MQNDRVTVQEERVILEREEDVKRGVGKNDV